MINKTFQKENSLQSEIVILNNFNDTVKAKPWVHGFVDKVTNKIYVLNMATMKSRSTIAAYNNETIASFEDVVIHEYTHKVIEEVIDSYNISTIKIPKWFHEGIATYYEDLYGNKIIENTASDIGDLRIDKNFTGNNNMGEYYERAAIVINYIISNYKETVIIDILESMSKGNDIYEALKIVTGESFEDITDKVLN